MDKQQIFGYVDSIEKALEKVADSIYDEAETGFEEFRSSALLRGRLEQADFVIDDLSGKVPNAFLARFGSGHPVVAILAEFDALPGMSQVAGVARMQPNENPAVKGFHGCGHHLFAAGCLGGALAAAEAIRENGLRGTIMFCACPAEEGGGGKTLMALAGAFDDVDCAITWHPDKMNAMRLFHTSALMRYDFRFRGVGAHAANEPEKGRSALDAVELMDIGVNYLREHVPATVRMHYAITHSGGAGGQRCAGGGGGRALHPLRDDGRAAGRGRQNQGRGARGRHDDRHHGAVQTADGLRGYHSQQDACQGSVSEYGACPKARPGRGGFATFKSAGGGMPGV